MSDSDDDALTWAGDERRRPPAPAPKAAEGRPAGGASAGQGPVALVALGVLAGVAVLESVFWVRGVLLPAITVSVGSPTGSPQQAVGFVVNVAGRVLACAAPVVWFGGVLRLVRVPSRRLAWLVLGAVLLLPWPFLIGAA